MILGAPAISKDAREASQERGRIAIQQLAGPLGLRSHHVESARRLFREAVEANYIQGRQTRSVAAACLYLVCRREGTSHMLIDFSDLLQMNVYALGQTVMGVRAKIGQQIPVVDPALYVDRFAAKLMLGNKTAAVCHTALRVIQRLKRDWLHTGRRPSGITGAALVIERTL